MTITNMKRNIRNGLFKTSLLGVALVAATSCSDWTEVESLELNAPTLESQNPELYAQYLQSLVDFKNSDHQVVIASFNNQGGIPSNRSQHLCDMPDSLDYICFANVLEVSQVNKDEMSEVRKKGTKVIGLIDFDKIDSDWKAILEAEANQQPAPAEEGQEGSEGEDDVEVDNATRFIEFCKAETTKALDACTALGVDGIEMNFTGYDLNSLVEEAIAAETARQGAFFDLIAAWKAVNADKDLLFKGLPQNVMTKSILSECKYIIVYAHHAVNLSQMSYLVHMGIMKDVPTDRFVIGVSTPYKTASGDAYGQFVDGTSSIIGAANWALGISDVFTRVGISVDNIEKDYFNVARIYPTLKDAINIISPTVK